MPMCLGLGWCNLSFNLNENDDAQGEISNDSNGADACVLGIAESSKRGLAMAAIEC